MKRLRYYREKAGLTQEGLAKLVGKSDRAISAYERGARNAPLSVALDIAEALHVDPGDLFSKHEVDVTETEQIEWLEETVKKSKGYDERRKRKALLLLEALKEELSEPAEMAQ